MPVCLLTLVSSRVALDFLQSSSLHISDGCFAPWPIVLLALRGLGFAVRAGVALRADEERASAFQARLQVHRRQERRFLHFLARCVACRAHLPPVTSLGAFRGVMRLCTCVFGAPRVRRSVPVSFFSVATVGVLIAGVQVWALP